MTILFGIIILFFGINFSLAADAKAYACINNATNQNFEMGCIDFEQNGPNITGTVKNLTAGLHGFHVHEYGNMSNACLAAGSHYNPFNNSHGAPTDNNRHVGDLGNINASADGNAVINMMDTIITLTGNYKIIGLAVVVHEKEDDLGVNKTDPNSQSTGNAGARIGCGIIIMKDGGSTAQSNLILIAILAVIGSFVK